MDERTRYEHAYRTFLYHGWENEAYTCAALISLLSWTISDVSERDVSETSRRRNERSPNQPHSFNNFSSSGHSLSSRRVLSENGYQSDWPLLGLRRWELLGLNQPRSQGSLLPVLTERERDSKLHFPLLKTNLLDFLQATYLLCFTVNLLLQRIKVVISSLENQSCLQRLSPNMFVSI